MAKFAKDAKVTQIVKPIEGVVKGFQVDQETGDVLVQVDWVQEDGSHGSRFFKEEELTDTPAT